MPRMNTKMNAWTLAMCAVLATGLSVQLSLAEPASDQKAPQPRKLTDEEVKQLMEKQAAQGASAPAAPGATGAAPVPEKPKAIELSETAFDWGIIPDTAPVSHTIQVKNITDQTIKIVANASCGCTVPKLDKDTLAPGESVPVTATFNPSGRNGVQSKQVTVMVVEPANTFASQVVSLTSNVRALVSIEPNKVYLNEVDHREGQQTTVTIVGRKPDFRVTEVTSTNEFVKATIGEAKTVEENGEQIVHTPITIDMGKGAPIGNLNAQLAFKTNDEAAKPQTLFVGGDVIGDVRSTPPTTMIRATAPGAAITGEMKIDTRSGKPFQLTSLELEGRPDMKLAADFSSTEDGRAYMITLSGVAPNTPGLVQGAVVVGTDSEGGETIRVPFTLQVPKAAATAAATNQTPNTIPMQVQPAKAPEASRKAPERTLDSSNKKQ